MSYDQDAADWQERARDAAAERDEAWRVRDVQEGQLGTLMREQERLDTLCEDLKAERAELKGRLQAVSALAAGDGYTSVVSIHALRRALNPWGPE